MRCTNYTEVKSDKPIVYIKLFGVLELEPGKSILTGFAFGHPYLNDGEDMRSSLIVKQIDDNQYETLNTIYRVLPGDFYKDLLGTALGHLWRMAHELDAGELKTAQKTIQSIEDEAWELLTMYNANNYPSMQTWLEDHTK